MTAQTLQLTLLDTAIHAIAQRVAESYCMETASSRRRRRGGVGGAEHLARPVSRIYDLVSLGGFAPHRDGRRLLFPRGDLDAVIEHH